MSASVPGSENNLENEMPELPDPELLRLAEIAYNKFVSTQPEQYRDILWDKLYPTAQKVWCDIIAPVREAIIASRLAPAS